MILFLEQIKELAKKTRINRINRAILLFFILGWPQFAHSQNYATADPNNRIIQQGADILMDGSAHVTGAVRSDKWFELINKSTPTTPSANHARLFLNNSSKLVCAIYDNGSTNCFAGGVAGSITGVTAGLGLTGGGIAGNVTLYLSTPIPNSYIDSSSITKQGNVFNGAGQLIQLDGNGAINIASGTFTKLYTTTMTYNSYGGIYNTATSSADVSYLQGLSTVASVTFSTIPVHCYGGQTLCVTEGLGAGDPARVMISTGTSYRHGGLTISYPLLKPGLILDNPLATAESTGVQLRSQDNALLWMGGEDIWNATIGVGNTQMMIGTYFNKLDFYANTISSNPIVHIGSDSVNSAMLYVVQPISGKPTMVVDSTNTAGSGIQFKGGSNSPYSFVGSDGLWQANNSTDTAIASYNNFVKMYASGSNTPSFTVASSSNTSQVLLGMNSNKISNLANGTAATDAAAFGQIFYGMQASTQCIVSGASSTTSSTFGSATLSCVITPTSSANRVKITVMGSLRNPNSNNTAAEATIERGGTDLSNGSGFCIINGAQTTAIELPCAMSYIDSPATTSATTYQIFIRSTDNATAVTWNASGLKSSMILEEIK